MSRIDTKDSILALMVVLLHTLDIPAMGEPLFSAIMEFVFEEDIASADLCGAGVDYSIVKQMADRRWDDDPHEHLKWLEPEKFWPAVATKPRIKR